MTTFSDNVATRCGGDVSVAGHATVNITTATFTKSTAEVGGSICLDGNASMFVTDCVITGTQATQSGGAVYAVGDSVLKITHTFVSGCRSQSCGGAVSAYGRATVDLVNITTKNTIGVTGGSLCVTETAKLSVMDSEITDAVAASGGGGVFVTKQSSAKLVNTVVSGCSTPGGGGGVSVGGTAGLELINSVVSNNIAGKTRDTDVSAQIHGGGVAVWSGASVLLEGSELTGNYAQYAGGGLYLQDYSVVAPSTAYKRNTPTLVHNNTARTTGGGIRLAAGLFPVDLSKYFRVDGNRAPNSPDISIAATSIKVVSSNADGLIASDNRDGYLQLVLNVTGANGMPSHDDLSYSLYDTNNLNLFSQTVRTQGTRLKELAISLKRPPGVLSMASCM